MEFAFTEEQQMIRDSAESFLQDVSTSESVRKAMSTEKGYDQELWLRICNELYLQAITIPEEFGGLGLGFVELVAVMEQMGRYLLCSPYFSTACLATTALNLVANKDQKAEYFGRLLSGETATLAFSSHGSFDASAVEVTYREEGDQYILNGDYRFVIDGHTSQNFILAAREEGSTGKNGIAFFICTANAEGISSSLLPTMDQTRKQASVSLTNLCLKSTQLMAKDAYDQLESLLSLSTIALSAEQVGGAQQVLDLTVEYTKERVQFNRPVASFQSVKHQAADMMTKVEASRSGLYYAACVADEFLTNGPMSNELNEAASVVKSYCSDAYFHNAGNAIQLHGGVGFTWEYDIHLYFKRAKASGHLLGNASLHRERIAASLLD